MNAEMLDGLFDRFSSVKDLRSLLVCIREFDGQTRSFGSLELPAVRLAVTGNYSTQFLCKALPLALAANGLSACIFESGYNAWQMDLRDLNSDLHAFAPTHILLTLTSIDLAYGALRTPEAIAKAVSNAVETVLTNTEARLLISLPEPLKDELSDQCSAYAWRQEVCAAMEAVAKNPRVTLVDLDPIVRHVGHWAWYDDRSYDTSKLPFHPNHTAMVSAFFSAAVAGTVVPRCKLIICDMDDTMWRGRVGDDGWQGVGLDPAGEGRHNLRLQHFLKGLSDQGVLLAIASKNEEAAVLDVFNRRPEMILSLADFVARQVHWEPKSTSIERILSELNLTSAGAVFLDDNPVEREEVRSRFPDLFIPELSENSAEWVPQLIQSGRFDRRIRTEESKRRLELYKENAKRERHKAGTSDIGAFLADLKMKMSSYSVDDHRERVLELIQKTNQFNLTTRRYGWGDIRTLSNGGLALCYRLEDRFGDNGIVSVIVVKKEDPVTYAVDLWLMSCRVMSRTFENAIIEDVIIRVKKMGGRTLIGRYIPSPKNAPVKDLYGRLGFTQVKISEAGEVLYRYELNDQPFVARTTHIDIEEAAGSASDESN